MKEIKLEDLLEAGVQFGHQRTRWNPKMKPYIFTVRDRLNILDLAQTKAKMEEAADFLMKLAKDGKKIVFVATKKQAQETIQKAAEKVGMPFIVKRWLGGTFTNFKTIKERIKKLRKLEEEKEKGELKKKYTKRERLMIAREIERLNETLGGLKTLDELPAAVFILDPVADRIAVREARRKHIPIVALMDSNADPDTIDYGIPSNDDALKAIELMTNYLADAIAEGKKSGLALAEEQKKAKEKEKVKEAEKKEVKQDTEKPQKKEEKTETKPEKKKATKAKPKTTAKKVPASKSKKEENSKK